MTRKTHSKTSLGCALGAMAMVVGAMAPLAQASAATPERLLLAAAENPCAPKAKKKATNPCAAAGAPAAKSEAKPEAKADAKPDAKPEGKDAAPKSEPK